MAGRRARGSDQEQGGPSIKENKAKEGGNLSKGLGYRNEKKAEDETQVGGGTGRKTREPGRAAERM